MRIKLIIIEKNMKKVLFLAAAAMSMAACQEKAGYTIDGTIVGANDGDYVYLSSINGRKSVVLDSAVVKGGKFQFTGNPDSVSVPKYISYNGNGQNMNVGVFLQKGNIKVEMAKGNTKVSGSSENETLDEFRNKYLVINDNVGKLIKKLRTDSSLSEAQKDSLVKVMDKMESEGIEYVLKTLEANVDNGVGAFLVSTFGYSLDIEDLDKAFKKMPQQYLSLESVTHIKKYVDTVIKTATGKKYIDFSMDTPEGKTVKLSDFVTKNKYTLIDFWASWCGPCRMEMPNVVAAYKKFHKKGFEIVGVSLDKDLDKWKQAIKDLDITWPQMSDLKAWQCEGAALYGVRSIPTTVLVGQDGTIVARNLRGDELEKKLSELFE